MKLNWQRPTAVSQLAEYLRVELGQRRWAGRMPGVIRLAEELGVARNTVEGALRELEQEGLLVPQGHGRGRLIQLGGAKDNKGMRVGIIKYGPHTQNDSYIIAFQHQLQEAGFAVGIAKKSLVEIHFDLRRLEDLVKRTEADAWVVVSGPREVLDWFVAQEIPVFALFGRRRELAIAGGGPDKSIAYRQMVRELMALGHRRIVLLAKKARRLPNPGLPERAFLEELAAHGITTGPYNLPDWEENPEDLQRLLDACLQVTPPTAFLVDEAYLFHAVSHHLNRRGIRCPDDISLICTDPDHTFTWCRPTIAHIHWDIQALLRRILRWAKNLQQGKNDRKQINIPAKFVTGGTVGVVKAEKLKS